MLREMSQHAVLGSIREEVGNMTELVRKYHVVIATVQELATLLRLDEACEEADVGFLVGVSRGGTGFIFVNLHKHRYVDLVGLSCLS